MHIFVKIIYKFPYPYNRCNAKKAPFRWKGAGRTGWSRGSEAAGGTASAGAAASAGKAAA